MTVSFNDTLERFNRKERNLLIRTVLGHSQAEPLLLSKTFCNQLTGALGLPETKPTDVRWWTDYHLNWLVAALRIFGDEAAVDMTLPSECVSHSGPVLTRLIHLVVVVVTVGMWKSD